MFFPTQDALRRAHLAHLDAVERDTEAEACRTCPLTSADAYAAAVNIRHEMSLLWSLTMAQHAQLVKISRGIWVLVALAGIIAYRLR